MRGRKPKPDRLRILAGDVRVIGSKELPRPPDWLKGDARAEWDRLIPELAKTYILSPLDANALAAYCETYAMWRQAARVVQEQGITFVADNGNVRCNPAAKLCSSLFEALRRMGSEFGFSPQARSRLEVPRQTTQEVDEFESFLEAR